MADYISTLTGVQMDQSLLDMAEHNSEAYAVGERNGVQVGPGDVTYQNNAKYYAQIATSQVEPGNIGDAIRWDTDQSTVLSDANKAQARKNIAAANTNPNLLDNWYWVGGGTAGKFPVNQRGKNYYESHDYMIDRWKSDSPWGGVLKLATQAEGVVLEGNVEPSYPTSYAELTQYINNPPVGKTVTVSVLADIVSPDSEGETPYVWINALEGMQISSTGLTQRSFVFPSGGTTFRITIPNGGSSPSSIRIQAVKLEVGSFSTLLQDAAPDYGEELMRCSYSTADPADSYGCSGFGRSNPNLLDNWYFVGGGSQLGDGVFPINQRGQTSYSGQYGIDRWLVSDPAISMTLQSNGLRVQASAMYVGLVQRLPAYKMQNGEVYTFSIIVDGNLHTATFIANNDGNWQNVYYGDNDWYVPYIFANGAWNFRVLNSRAQTMDRVISAVKIEKGTVSTLANDPPPDFGEELRKCQRYLWVESIGANTPIASGVAFNTSSVFDFITPVPMRNGATIQITFNVTPYITYGTGNLALAGGTSSITSGKNGNHLRVQIGTSADVGNLTEVHLLCGTDTVMTVSCEL